MPGLFALHTVVAIKPRLVLALAHVLSGPAETQRFHVWGKVQLVCDLAADKAASS